ncbi:hypothetical protein [Dactylosporangium sp. NPDC050588]|uniref:hypothetical protein n=1 Tax=Dactylosporangium sp. NPDC050588 TaxID=3157211 RepID=UPI0033FBDC98
MDVADAPLGIAVIKLVTIDPALTLERLRSATDIREDGPASGDDWTGKRFTFSLADTGDKPLGAARTITGAVDVDDQDRIRRLQVSFAGSDERIVTQFSDFGVAVTVTAPPAGVVQQNPKTKPSPGAKSSGGNASDKAAEDKQNAGTAGPGTK